MIQLITYEENNSEKIAKIVTDFTNSNLVNRNFMFLHAHNNNIYYILLL